MNFFLVAAVIFAFNSGDVPKSYSAQEVYQKVKARAEQIDSTLDRADVQFTQEIEMRSRAGNVDSLVFRISILHGKFVRHLVSTSVPNGDRFDGGYDAFDKMFFLSEYFSDSGRKLSSCSFDSPQCDKCYGIRFALSSKFDPSDPYNTVSASLNAYTFTPMHIDERVKGLPLGIEFENNVDVAYDPGLNTYFPSKIVMQVFGRLLFIKGEIGVITIKNENLRKM